MDVSDPSALDSGKLTLGGLVGAVDLAGAFTAGFTGSVTNLTLNPVATRTPTYSGVIADGASGMTLTKTGLGTQTLSGDNTYTGGTAINGGTLALGSAGALGSSGTIAFGGGTLQYSASNTTDYSARFSNAASQQYSIDTNSQSVTLASDLTSTGGSFTKLGAGTLALTGANTYDGATTVSAGALQVGSGGLGQTGTGAVTAQTGSTLLGTGLVQGTTFTLDDGGTLRPGDSLADSSHGTLTFNPVSPSGDTSLQGDIILGISGATITDTTYGGNLLGSAGYNTWVDGVSGVGTHDRLVFLGSGSHNVSFLTSTGRLEVVGSSFTPERGQVFNLMDWSGLINPNPNFTGFTFNSYVTGNGDEGADMDLPDISGSGFSWDLSRFTTSGNIVVIPEPSRTVLMLVGLAGLALRRRRRVNRALSHSALRLYPQVMEKGDRPAAGSLSETAYPQQVCVRASSTCAITLGIDANVQKIKRKPSFQDCAF
jgi:autotransporter-associated beta strand protein